jgi:putative MATE family efflux protein
MLGIVDTFFVARLGAAQLAGVGAALQPLFFLFSILSAIAVGASVLVAQATGAGERRRAALLAKQSLVGATLLAVPVSLLGVALAIPAMHLFGLTGAVAGYGALYTRITMSTSLVLVVGFVAGALLRGAGDTRTPMLVTLLSNVINAVAAYGLIFGHLGLPALGVAGSAWAAVIGRTVSALVLVGLLVRGRGVLSVTGWWGWRPELRRWREVLTLGVPAATEQVLITLAFSALTVVVAHLGVVQLAAQRLAINVLQLSFLPGFGCAIAASTLVGQSVGARNPAEGVAAAGIATRLALFWMSALGLLFAVFATPLMRAFTSDARVSALGAGCLVAIAAAQPGWAIGDVLAGGLRGAGNTVFPMLANVVTLWLAVLLGFVGVRWAGGDLLWTWWAFTLATPVGTVAIVWRFRRWAREERERALFPPTAPVVSPAAD